MSRGDGVLFIPGFFGFGSFGPKHRPLIEYFSRVRDELDTHFPHQRLSDVHEPPPTGSLTVRVKSLHQRIEQILREGLHGRPVRRLHLVGHSTGGLDARLLLNPRYLWPGGPYGAARTAYFDRIASVVTVSTPFHGTPLARRLQGGMELSIPGLYFASILASRRQLRLAGHVGDLYRTLKQLTLQKATPTEELIARLAGVDEETAQQIRRFLNDVLRDYTLVDDLTPRAMADLNADIAGADFPRLHSFVTVAPPPGWGLRDAIGMVRTPLRRSLYATTYMLSAGPAENGMLLPTGPWIDDKPRRLQLDDPGANDGVVPAWSQTLDGRAAGLVAADHLDVIGHYETVGATFFRSGSGFRDARFRELWRRVAAVLRAS
jgi:hypothetical protein